MLASDLRKSVLDLEDFLVERLRHQPYATLSVAVTAGYVLGGGLASRFTFVMLNVATRVAAALAIREVSERYQPAATGSAADPSGAGASRQQAVPLHDTLSITTTDQTSA